MIYGHTLALGCVSYECRLDDECSFRQVLQEEMAGLVGCRGYGGTLHPDDDVREVLARLCVHHMTIYIGIRVFGCFFSVILFACRGSYCPVFILYNTFVLNFGSLSCK